MKIIFKKLLVGIFVSFISELIAFFALDGLKKKWRKEKNEEDEWKMLLEYKYGKRPTA